MKRQIVDYVNEILRPIGIGIYKEGYDMKSALKRLKNIPNFEKINTVIDIGASNGRWSKEILTFYPTNLDVCAIEALKEREKDLMKLKTKYSQFDFIISAAGDKMNKSIKLNVTSDLDGSTINSSNPTNIRLVPQVTIDEIVSKKKLNGSFIIKFDTHGYEIPIISGSISTLQQTEIIIMEVYNFKITENTLIFHDMIRHLDTLGFRVFDIVDLMRRPTDEVFWQMDLFFLRKENPIFYNGKYVFNEKK